MNVEPVVYLVDDDPGVLKALIRLLRAEGYAAQAFNSPVEFLREHDPLAPGCVVLDICMPNIDGLALQQDLLTSGCERVIVFVTGHGDIATSVQAMKAGAVDFLTKPFYDEDFLAAVRNAIAKDEHARKVRLELQSIRWRMATLTPRERQVLQHVVAGRLNKQIAADLGIAEKTIKVHRARAMEKMCVASLAELVRITVEADVGAVVENSPHDKTDRYGKPGFSRRYPTDGPRDQR
jgi:two-component system, LuxR family, response regulator FixJ